MSSFSDQVPGAVQILNERMRQLAVSQHGEGFTAEHDDEHVMGELIGAAMCYAGHALGIVTDDEIESADSGDWWPWSAEWFKPSADPIRNLVKAGALIAAEIDRLQRRDDAT